MLVVALLSITLGSAPRDAATKGTAEQGPAARNGCVTFDHEHAAWTALLSRHVSAGVVDYAGLAKSGRGELSAYLRSLETVCRADYDGWSRQQKLAYWINAYNAYMIRLILAHYPVASVNAIGLGPGAAFREEVVPASGVLGRVLSLNDIEHEILRKELREPRIHFAIVCASESCPQLRSTAYRAKDVDQQLDEAARRFIRDPSKNRFDAPKRTLFLSSIFSWFREDFERAPATLTDFVARYADDATAAGLRPGNVTVEFLEYSWVLNGK